MSTEYQQYRHSQTKNRGRMTLKNNYRYLNCTAIECKPLYVSPHLKLVRDDINNLGRI